MDTLALFKNASDTEEYGAGEVIFNDDQPGDVMYVILEGEVKVVAHGCTVNKLGPGDLLGEMALIDASPRCASAVALSHCKLARVNERRFLFMVEHTPFFALHVMRVLVSKLRLMTASVGTLQDQSPV
ncbi:MAG: cyclic nucleotide-binding domain-containing protein [Methylococcaceae bacterium]|nr:cyclic nucleotide-binding domain-containing protein [Methylococcaceae bacterium]MCI0732418.1 cyclic nucleotide-binding domain-containing protein [Methylococcaceae bacterium]